MNEFLFHADPRSVADKGDELSIQVRFRARVKMVMPRVWVVAIPNAGKRGFGAISKVHAEGLAKGFPDTAVIWPQKVAFIEFKPKNGTLSLEQVDWLNRLHQAGHPCGMFRSVATAIDFLLQCGAPSLTGVAL